MKIENFEITVIILDCQYNCTNSSNIGLIFTYTYQLLRAIITDIHFYMVMMVIYSSKRDGLHLPQIKLKIRCELTKTTREKWKLSREYTSDQLTTSLSLPKTTRADRPIHSRVWRLSLIRYPQKKLLKALKEDSTSIKLNWLNNFYFI